MNIVNLLSIGCGQTNKMPPHRQCFNVGGNFITRFISIFIIFTLILSTLYGQTKKDSLYAFVGKKISIKQFFPSIDGNHILMDGAFKAKYSIVQNIFGDFHGDTIEFDAYDHFGVPAFSKYDYVLLFVSSINGHLYHEKYQFFDVYKTIDNRWASTYRVQLYEDDTTTTVKPHQINFIKQVSYDIKSRSTVDIMYLFPEPYYKIIDNKAIAVYGNYVDELFQLEKETILKARGFFNRNFCQQMHL